MTLRMLSALIVLSIGCAKTPDSENDVFDLGLDQGIAFDVTVHSADDAQLPPLDATSLPFDAAIPMCEDGIACGTDCTDIQTDPNHCGGCGRTCRFPSAQALCENGACVIGDCDPGYFDQDEDPETGCELEDSCVANELCSTTCETDGVTICDDGIQSCMPPQDTCNALDDNCDNRCDENAIAGCRIGVYRSYAGTHAYHNDAEFLADRGFNIERMNYFYVYQSPFQGMRPMFLCPKGDGSFFLASGTACEPEMRSPVAEVGFWSPTPLCDSIPLYGLYKADINNHFYTTSISERDSVVSNLGYEDRGIAGYVWPAP